MNGRSKYISFLSIVILLSATAHAQTDANDKKAKSSTEQAAPATATPAKSTSEKTTTAAPEEKKKWALRIKQGEKWYQLSLELNY